MTIPSLLSRATVSDLRWTPFPHIVARPAIDPELTAALTAQFPSMQQLTGRTSWPSNTRYSYGAHKAFSEEILSPLWREMIEVHTAQSFLHESLELLADPIRKYYPDFEKRFGALRDLRAGTRGIDRFESVDMLLDAQICINTPVTGSPSSVRRGHVDRPNKLFAGLFYLRHPDDRSHGGDLQLFRFRPGGESRFNTKYIEDKWIAAEITIPYECNVLVLFLNGPWAVHGVTSRSRAALPRMFLNLVGEVSAPLFDLSHRQTSFPKLRSAKRLAKQWGQRAFSPRVK